VLDIYKYRDTEATTLWIEHTTLSQQRYKYRGNNIVDRTHHPLSTKYRDTENNIVDIQFDNWAYLETIRYILKKFEQIPILKSETAMNKQHEFG